MTRRRVMIALLLLTAGAVLSLGVAWGVPLAMEPGTGAWTSATRSSPGVTWDVRRNDQFGTTVIDSLWLTYDRPGGTTFTSPVPPERLVPWWCHLRRLEGQLDPQTTHDERHLVAHGWPFRAVYYQSGQSSAGPIDPSPNVWVVPAGSRSCWLPRRPVWSGMVLNSLAYAVAIGAVFVLPLELLRRARRRDGACEKCGYPLKKSTRCPECGSVARAPVDEPNADPH